MHEQHTQPVIEENGLGRVQIHTQRSKETPGGNTDTNRFIGCGDKLQSAAALATAATATAATAATAATTLTT